MQISKIERQIKNKERYSIFIDDEFVFGLSGVDVLQYKLKEGEEITQDRYEYLLNNVVYLKARDKAVRYLAYKPRTKTEVVQKLKQDEYTEEIISRVLEEMEKYNYINDEEYTNLYVQYLSSKKKYGTKRIKFELERKGIEKDIICKVLNDADFEEVESAILLLEKKLRGGKMLTPDSKQRYYGFLARRGYSNDIIKKAFKNFDTE